jgi:hypothetical protein
MTWIVVALDFTATTERIAGMHILSDDEEAGLR